jgi:hypothetical protein
MSQLLMQAERLHPAVPPPVPADLFGDLIAAAFGRRDVIAPVRAQACRDVVVAGLPVAQGDLFIQPWPRSDAPAERAAAVRATRDLHPDGVDLLGDGRHVLTPVGPQVAWGGQASASGLTLGTLVVGAGSLARLVHAGHHGDLRIGGACVYVIRRQRDVAAIPEPQAQPDDDSGSYWAMVMD